MVTFVTMCRPFLTKLTMTENIVKTTAAIVLLALFANGRATRAQTTRPAFLYAGDSRMGVCTHFAQGWNAEKIMPEIEKSGFDWIRDDLGWEPIESKKGEYHIPDQTLAWIRSAHAHHLRLLLILNGSNRLYADKYDPQAFAKWGAWIATELKNDVDALEILNEPNNFGFSKTYGGQHEGEGNSPWVAKYVALMNTTAEAIKAANPTMPVIGFGAGAPVTYRQLAMGTSSAVDAIADHPYSNQSPPELLPGGDPAEQLRRFGFSVTDERGSFSSLIGGFRRESVKHHGPGQIWLTEWGFSTFQPLTANQFGGFTETAQAKYILRRFVQGFGLGVDVSFLYEFRDGRNPHDAEACWGVVRENGEPKESLQAVKNLAAIFHGMRVPGAPDVGAVNVFPAATWPQAEPIAIYRFLGEGYKPAVAIWATDRAGGDRQPRVGDIEFMWNVNSTPEISSIDLLTGKRETVAFKRVGNRLLVEAATIHDYPVLYVASNSSLLQAPSSPVAQKSLELFNGNHEWSFNDGREFPGATGSFDLKPAGEKPLGTLHYDFTKGGAYVAAQTHATIENGADEFRIAAKSSQAMRMSVRLVDATGQCHQYVESCSGTGDWETLRVVLTKGDSEHWGGANDGKMHFPVKEISICVNKPSKEMKGTVEFSDAVTVN
jgi:hypothetical protein